MKFLRNVISELKKVRWPDKNYMIKYTVATLALIVFFAAYFSVITVAITAIKEII